MTLSPNSGHPIVKWNNIRQKVRQETYFIVIKQILKFKLFNTNQYFHQNFHKIKSDNFNSIKHLLLLTKILDQINFKQK